jgi:hypothetical protein
MKVRSWWANAGLALLALTLLAACGRKTDPITPDSPRPAAVTDIKVAVRADVAFLTWPVPVTNIEGKPLPAGDIVGFRIFRADVVPGRRRLRYKEHAAIDLAAPGMTEVRNGTVTWRDPGLQYGRVYAYRIKANSAKGWSSAYSEEVHAAPLPTLAAPKDLSASAGDSAVTLAWRAVTTKSDGSTHEGFVGYNVYRGTAAGQEAGKPVNGEPVRTNGYTDPTAVNDTTYFYRVRAVDSPVVPWKESLDSNEASATPRDRTPPAPPAGITVVPGIGRVFLTWKENQEPDLAGYFVYRTDRRGGEYERLTDKPVNRSTFSDETVKQGKTYWYAITAVDKSGNESGRSQVKKTYTEKIR